MAYYANMIYHLDLCILAYHLYGQSLVWPMDPYYEPMDFGAVGDRRKNFMVKVRGKLSNIEFASYSNNICRDELDPILYSYDRMNPKQPVLYRPETDQWLYFKPIREIVDSIHTVYMSRIINPTPEPIPTNPINGKGTDHLYCFEGIFGLDKNKDLMNPKTDGQKAMTGFILDKEVDTGLLHNIGDTYDVHIIFRGSRSGKGGRSFWQGRKGKGNADWVTDMQFGVTINDENISKKGRVSIGFKLSLDTMIECINSCLEDINKRRGQPPRNIYLAGHSLAGALAGQFTSAMILGNGTHKSSKLKLWDFSRIHLRTYGCPTFGDTEFANYWEGSSIKCERIKVNWDPITTDIISKMEHIGELKETPIESFKPDFTLNHRFEITRESLLNFFPRLKTKDLPSSPIFATDKGKMPKTLREVIGSVNSPLPQFNQQDLANYLEILKETLYDPSSYAPEKTMSLTRDNARKVVLGGLIQDISTILTGNITRSLRKRMSNLFDSDEVNFIWLCFVMLKLSQGNQVTNIQDFESISQKV